MPWRSATLVASRNRLPKRSASVADGTHSRVSRMPVPDKTTKDLRIHAPASRKAYHGKPRARRHARHNSQKPFDALR